MTAIVSTPRSGVFGVLISMGDHRAMSLFIECLDYDAAKRLCVELVRSGKHMSAF